MFDYSLIRQVLLAREGNSFTAEQERFAAAQALGGDIDALQVIAEYAQLRGCYFIKEPFPKLESSLHQKWERSSQQFWGMRSDRFMDHLSQYYLGECPSFNEVLPAESYEKIYRAFQLLIVPGLMVGRIDAFATGRVRSNTLQKILEGYEEFRVFVQKR